MSRNYYRFSKENEQILKSIAIKLGVTFLKQYLEIMIYKLPNIEVNEGVLEDEKYKYIFSLENINGKTEMLFSILGFDIENNEFEFNIKD